MMVEVFMDLQLPARMARIVDIGIAGRDAAYILREGWAMVAIAACGFAGGVLCSLLAARAAVSVGGALRQGVFGKALCLSCADLDSFKASSLVTRCTNDVMQVQNMVLMLLRGMVRMPLILVGSVVMAVSLSLPLSAVFALALPVIVAAIALVMARATRLFSESQAGLDGVNTVMREGILGIRVAKAFRLEEMLDARFAQANGRLTRSGELAQGTTFLLMPIVGLAMNLCVVAVLWFGGGMAAAGDIELGKIMAFVNYLLQIAHAVMFIVNLMLTFSRASASAGRLGDVLEASPSVRPPAAPVSPSGYRIEMRGVSLSYAQAGKPALEGISLDIAEGESLGVIGATGSGKSTLAALFPRLYDSSAGTVAIGGVDVRDWDLRRLRATVGLATQESFLFSGSIGDNAAFGLEEGALNRKGRIDEALADSQAAEFVSALQAGSASRVEQRGRNLSGGQKQRLSIARALALEPRILVLDDSASALDLGTEARLRSALAARRARKPFTLITIAQRVSAVMGCDRILVLDFGRVAALGPHAELLARSPIYRDIVASQLGEEALSRG
jgi:ATP-binding cassette subfamily B protein